jgi:hypothetical protein
MTMQSARFETQTAKSAMNSASRDAADSEHHDGKGQDQSLMRLWVMKDKMKVMVGLAELMRHRS